jgi:hypothetical protein
MESTKRQFEELLAYSTLESTKTRLEAFADSFERVADGRKQTELAQEFNGFVADIVRHPLTMGDLNGLFGVGHWLEVYASDFRWIGGSAEFNELVQGLEEFGKECIAAYGSWRQQQVPLDKQFEEMLNQLGNERTKESQSKEQEKDRNTGIER